MVELATVIVFLALTIGAGHFSHKYHETGERHHVFLALVLAICGLLLLGRMLGW
jgi:hypothetical protein